VVLRWVIPNTTEANRANNTAALKCERLMVTVSSPAQYGGRPQRR
jgi:hypothetical protein